MATSDLAAPRGVLQSADTRSEAMATWLTPARVLAALASLRLTVALFALSIVLIFLGTLAQKDNDVWRVVNDTYFRVWFARVDFVVFERLAQLFFKTIDWNLKGGFYFLGGKTLGLLLLINLGAAHAIRFKVAAEGKRLLVGLVMIAVGVLLTAVVILSGSNQGVDSELSADFCDVLWQSFRGLLALLTLAGAYIAIFWGTPARRKLIEWWLLVGTDVILAVLTVYLLTHPDARLDNSGIRILWQLAKGSASGIALLIGCVLVFRKRAGIVLLHGGIALIMLTELFTAVAAVESQMSIPEGGTANYSSDIRTSELAIVDHSPAEHDQVTVIPQRLLVANVGRTERIDDPALPFTIQVHRWLDNSDLRDVKAGESNPATAGFGKTKTVEAVAASTGVGESAEKIDFPSAFIELFSKKDGSSLGTYLVSNLFVDNDVRPIEQSIEVDGHKYDVALRFERIYHPFSVTLKKFDMSHYVGTKTAKNYSSLVEFKDPRYNVEREVPIWMNNPLRYAWTTLYQQSYRTDATGNPTTTVLQVVRNPSWMTPYVGCMLVGIGMLAHFGTMLVRFLRKRNEHVDLEEIELEEITANPSQRGRAGTAHRPAKRPNPRQRGSLVGGGDGRGWQFGAVWFPALVVLVFAGYIAGKSRMPKSAPSEMQIYEFGELPLVYEGRVKPYDTVARNMLQVLSGRQEVGVINDQGDVTGHLPAIRWLLDVVSNAPGFNDHRVFRVENVDLLDSLDLPKRPQFWRYSYNELNKKKWTFKDENGQEVVVPELGHQIQLAMEAPEKQRNVYQTKVIELARKRNMYEVLAASFQPPPLSSDEKAIAASWQKSMGMIATLNEDGAPHVVPPTSADGKWTILMQAQLEYLRNRVMKQPLNPATVKITEMLGAYARGDVAGFNKNLVDYRELLDKYEGDLQANRKQLVAAGMAKAEIMSQAKSDFEVFFNQFSPFYYAMVLYVFAGLLGIGAWIEWTQPLRRASIWLLWLTLALHTFALIARVYISGRPPITNLYSTAIFIGWAVVLMSLVFESIYRLGLGNVIAAVVGFISLFLAYNLSLDGDTFIVLQAVLDTQFWLATHVITINLGYAATYLAGTWGIAYILCGRVFNILDKEGLHVLLRILYGTLCFAIFFSFIGTVLGGLWADDSWGRFWGWDPKENGALMIVLWNALVLHARWGALVKGRGLAALAVAGNIVTTWSYFGVNEYGVGLHAYGASSSSTAMWLLMFGITQVAIITLALLPESWFESFGSKDPTARAA